MKNLLYLLIVMLAFTAAVASCSNDDKQEASVEQGENLDSINDLLRDSMQLARADIDTLMSLMTEVNEGLTEIKDLEGVVSNYDANTESADRRDQLRSDINSIKQNVKKRMKKLDDLEQRLKKSDKMNEQLQETITSLRKQLKDQQAMIEDLVSQLESAHAEIRTLNVKVDSLKTENTTVNTQRQQAEAENQRLTNEMNECYFVVGSNKELKQHKIIEGGFLRKTKIMEGDFSRTYFTKADKRTLNQIALHSKKAKVLSKHPKGSYEIVDQNGQKVLRILSSHSFWELSNYLVVQVD